MEFRTASADKYSFIQQQLNQLGSWKAEAMKNKLHKSVAEMIGKLVTKYTKVQKIVENLLEDHAALVDKDVVKTIDHLQKAKKDFDEIEACFLHQWFVRQQEEEEELSLCALQRIRLAGSEQVWRGAFTPV